MPLRSIQRRKKNSYLYLKNFEQFRSQLISLGKRNGNISYNNSSFLNPFVYFEVVTKQLVAGNHNFKFRTIDNLGNISEEIQCPITIAEFVLPPRFLTAVVSGSRVTLNWQHSIQGIPTSYAIYGTDDINQLINRNTEFNGLAASCDDTSISFNLPDGVYNFTVDALVGSKKSFNYVSVRVVTPSTSAQAPQVINPIDSSNLSLIDIGPLQIFAENVHLGKLRIEFLWPYGNLASKFRIYHDSGSGTVDFSSPIEFNRINSIIQNFTTERIAFDSDDKTFKYVVRSVTVDGVEDSNVFENEVVLDGGRPPNVSGIQIDSTL